LVFVWRAKVTQADTALPRVDGGSASSTNSHTWFKSVAVLLKYAAVVDLPIAAPIRRVAMSVPPIATDCNTENALPRATRGIYTTVSSVLVRVASGA